VYLVPRHYGSMWLGIEHRSLVLSYRGAPAALHITVRPEPAALTHSKFCPWTFLRCHGPLSNKKKPVTEPRALIRPTTCRWQRAEPPQIRIPADPSLHGRRERIRGAPRSTTGVMWAVRKLLMVFKTETKSVKCWTGGKNVRVCCA